MPRIDELLADKGENGAVRRVMQRKLPRRTSMVESLKAPDDGPTLKK
jgi:hypothetical protein